MGSKEQRNLEEALLPALTEETTGEDEDKEVINRKMYDRSSKSSLEDAFGKSDGDLYDMKLDSYNMFFISGMFSQDFFYALAVFFTKILLYLTLILDMELGKDKEYPFDRTQSVKWVVQFAQILLIPIMILVEEDLVTTFHIFGSLKYNEKILQVHPGATRWKFYTANTARAIDGFMFLFINTTVMLRTTDVLSVFLNFAALMFLQEIDNVAVEVCLEGFWSNELQEAARRVVALHMEYDETAFLKWIQSIFFVVTYLLILTAWLFVHQHWI